MLAADTRRHSRCTTHLSTRLDCHVRQSYEASAAKFGRPSCNFPLCCYCFEYLCILSSSLQWTLMFCVVSAEVSTNNIHIVRHAPGHSCSTYQSSSPAKTTSVLLVSWIQTHGAPLFDLRLPEVAIGFLTGTVLLHLWTRPK